jgi:hypothetical protein
MTLSRRNLLGGCLSGCALALAGCTTDSGEPDDTADDDSEQSPALQVGEQFLNSSFPMEIYDPETDNRLVQIHWHGKLSNSHWHQQPLSVPLNRWQSYEMRALDSAGDTIQLGEDQPLQLAMVRTEETPEDRLAHEISGNLIDMRGQDSGNGQYVFRIRSSEGVEWESPLLLVSVD